MALTFTTGSFFLASILRHTRWHASSLDSTEQTLAHSCSLFCLFWTLWVPPSSWLHCHCNIALSSFQHIVKICLLISFWIASWWRQRGPLISSVRSFHSVWGAFWKGFLSSAKMCVSGWLSFLENGTYLEHFWSPKTFAHLPSHILPLCCSLSGMEELRNYVDRAVFIPWTHLISLASVFWYRSVVEQISKKQVARLGLRKPHSFLTSFFLICGFLCLLHSAAVCPCMCAHTLTHSRLRVELTFRMQNCPVPKGIALSLRDSSEAYDQGTFICQQAAVSGLHWASRKH